MQWVKPWHYHDGVYSWRLDVFKTAGGWRVCRDGRALTGLMPTEDKAREDAVRALQRANDSYHDRLGERR